MRGLAPEGRPMVARGEAKPKAKRNPWNGHQRILSRGGAMEVSRFVPSSLRGFGSIPIATRGSLCSPLATIGRPFGAKKSIPDHPSVPGTIQVTIPARSPVVVYHVARLRWRKTIRGVGDAALVEGVVTSHQVH